MTNDNHALNLGKLIVNLHSLELTLRLFLHSRPNARPTGLAYGVNIYAQPVGTALSESDITSYASLRKLINDVNVELTRRGIADQVDPDLNELRDALAHGRVSANIDEDTMRLIKFTRPVNGSVEVSFNTLMSDEWFSEQRRRVYEAMQIVSRLIPGAELI
ncbi:hypothetical protein [Duganella sp. CF458]|uniref:hypothetical protein n=1 Tax=Duganella sp. CF458 TaxID=1884368 RepID=UPI000B84F69E|nr:hypothetical protein [Duganella sp. CF458]